MRARTTSTVRLKREGRTNRASEGHASSEHPLALRPRLSLVLYDEDEAERTQTEPSPPAAVAATEVRAPRPRDVRALAQVIMERIRSRTGERVRDLDVQCEPGRVVISGRCATFYTKQLAQHAAMGVIEDETLLNEIAVGFNR